MSIKCVSIRLNWTRWSMEFDLFHCCSIDWTDLIGLICTKLSVLWLVKCDLDLIRLVNVCLGSSVLGLIGFDPIRLNKIETRWIILNWNELNWMFDPIHSDCRVTSIWFDWLRLIAPHNYFINFLIRWPDWLIDWENLLRRMFGWIRLASIGKAWVWFHWVIINEIFHPIRSTKT